MRVGVYLMAAATAVTLPGIVANQMGMRIGDLSMFEDEAEEEQPDGPAPQLVIYEDSEADPAAEVPVDEEMLPRRVKRTGSFVALPDPVLVAMRDRILAERGEAPEPEPEKGGGH
ncbi:hypothetical protein OB2597_20301 [Pseudooceanicola batsensis HTCC2597]|uniref:Uncharacterized protein n=1 Tax=Pseudooceanicola batsensis (strain ATCC BAA-863 / DSM 15984 / KCTC 12145 / HTCC2597) TaxID=252305 RepID=A3U120_PSEBH|nr:hypothetical protein [Pseudooceanicola batsensis]EAQ02003.1 hypothetical protein OB2597_20301 [Pseudooceanicola batsensis HTCC2597]